VPGRFPLYRDADIQGPVVKALIRNGWDVVRAIDVFAEGTKDRPHFEDAATQGRVLVANDEDQEEIAIEWLKAGRSFPGLIIWPQRYYELMTTGEIVDRVEELASKVDPFAYPIVYLKLKE
jgi:hypothetical protein